MGTSFWRKNSYWLLSNFRTQAAVAGLHNGEGHRLNSMPLRWSENPSHMPTSEATEPFNHKALLNLVKQLWSWHLSWLCAHPYRRAMFWGQRGVRIQTVGPVNQVFVLWELWPGRCTWKHTYAIQPYIKNYRQLKMPSGREMVFPKEEHINCLWKTRCLYKYTYICNNN